MVKRLVDVDITDRDDGRLLKWSDADGTHIYEDPAVGTFDPDYMPWRYEFVSLLGATVNSGFTMASGSANISEDQWADHGMVSTAQNHEIAWDQPLAAGTWDVHVLFFRATLLGIATVTFDATSVGTIDMYGSSQSNTVGSITGITVSTTGKVRIKLKGATKNASSSGYALWISQVILVRTA